MKGIALDVYQFYLFNYEDWLKLFEDQKNAVIAKMNCQEKFRFNPYHFDYKETQKLYKKYQYISIFPDDTLWGSCAGRSEFIHFKEGLYQFALSYFNKDLTN